jgi:plastocyanin
MTRRPLVAVLLALAITSILGACGGSNKVGNNALLNVKDQVSKNRLGERTTTVPVETTTSLATAALGVRPATTKPPTATTVAHEQVITINADRSAAASQFDPNTATVYTNYPVRFQNNDTVARSVVVTNGDQRRSPSIAPGQSWTTQFAAAGTYNYQDGTRPYAVGSITVVAR